MLIFLCIFTSEEFEEGEGDAEEEATHASFLSEGKTVASLTLSFPSVHIYSHPPRRTFLANLCFSKLLMITFGWTRPLCSVQNTRNNFPAVGLLLLDDSLGSDASCRRFICLHFHRSEWGSDRGSTRAGRDEWESNDPQSFSSRPRWANNTVCVHHDWWRGYS